MVWSVEIKLRDNTSEVIENLTSINTKSDTNGSITSLTDFSKFHLLKGKRLSFISDTQVFSVNSSDILSMSFHKN